MEFGISQDPSYAFLLRIPILIGFEADIMPTDRG